MHLDVYVEKYSFKYKLQSEPQKSNPMSSIDLKNHFFQLYFSELWVEEDLVCNQSPRQDSTLSESNGTGNPFLLTTTSLKIALFFCFFILFYFLKQIVHCFLLEANRRHSWCSFKSKKFQNSREIWQISLKIFDALL